MLVFYKKSAKEIIFDSGTSTAFPDGGVVEFQFQQNVLPKFGGVENDYGYFSLNDLTDSDKVRKVMSGKYDMTLVFSGDTPTDMTFTEKPVPLATEEIDEEKAAMAEAIVDLDTWLFAIESKGV